MIDLIDSPAAFANRLRRCREAAGLSLREATQGLGFSSSMLSKMETGMRLPSAAVLVGLASRLNVTPLYLMTGEHGLCPFCHRPEVALTLDQAILWVEESPVPITLNLNSRIVAASQQVADMLGVTERKDLRGADPSAFVDLHGEAGDSGTATIRPFQGEEFRLDWRSSEWWIEGQRYELVEGARA